jgi:hypothetical protein
MQPGIGQQLHAGITFAGGFFTLCKELNADDDTCRKNEKGRDANPDLFHSLPIRKP